MLLCHSGMPEPLDYILETAGTQYALGIWRIYSRPVGFWGLTAGQLDLADPLFYRCLFADLLRIDCGPGRRSIWRIYCKPVVFCGSTAGQLDLAEPLFHRCLFADLLRIDGGPVDRSGHRLFQRAVQTSIGRPTKNLDTQKYAVFKFILEQFPIYITNKIILIILLHFPISIWLSLSYLIIVYWFIFLSLFL